MREIESALINQQVIVKYGALLKLNLKILHLLHLVLTLIIMCIGNLYQSA